MNVVKRTLDNGLTVLSEPLHAAPVVAMQAWVSVGSADERDEQAGIAHVHEHMLFKGTARRGVGHIARDVEAAGGEINAWTSFDQTVYHLVMARGELSLGLDILSDALRHSTFDAEELARELEVVVEEIRRSEDSPSRRAATALFGLAFPNHPYGKPVIGTEASVRAMTRENILDFYREYYRPDEITLVVVGDFEQEQLDRLVNELFADWQNPTERPRKHPRNREGEQEGLAFRHLREDVRESRVSVAWRIPEVHHEDIAALDALSTILGAGDASRLFVEVRRRRQLVNDCYAYAFTPRDPGLLVVGAGFDQAHLDDAITAIVAQTYALRETKVSQEELSRAKIMLLSEEAYQRETVQGQARKRGFFQTVAGDYLFEEAYNNALRALTPEAIREVARRYLHPHPAVVLQTPTDVPEWSGERMHQCVRTAWSTATQTRPSRRPGSYDVIEVQLENGPLLLLRSEPNPVVAMRAVALGGLRWEGPSTYGLSFLLGSLWGTATQTMDADTLARHVAGLGGSLSAYGGRNSLGLRGEFLQDTVHQGLGVFCDALLRPAFTAEDLQRERAVILQRLKNRDDNPAGVCYDAFAAALFPTHPYGQRILGTEQTLEGFHVDALQQHWRQFASPDKLVLSVVGGIDVNEVIDFLAERFADGVPGEALPAAPPPDSPPTSRVTVRHALDKQQAHILVGSMGTTLFDDDRFAIEVMTSVLSGQSGRLFLDLRDRQSLAYAVSSSSLEGLDPGYVLMHIATAPDKVSQALLGLYRHLEALRQTPISDDELLRAQRYLVGSHAIDLQRCGARAMIMALNQRYGLGYDHHLGYAEKIRGVTAEDVQRVANTYLSPEGLVEAVVGPDQ